MVSGKILTTLEMVIASNVSKFPKVIKLIKKKDKVRS